MGRKYQKNSSVGAQIGCINQSRKKSLILVKLVDRYLQACIVLNVTLYYNAIGRQASLQNVTIIPQYHV